MDFSINFYAYPFVFLLIPCFSSICLHTLPCNKSIIIKPPFYSNETNDKSCQRKIKTRCLSNIPKVYPFNNNISMGFQIESISYGNNTMVIQDPDAAHSLLNSSCDSFVFNVSINFYNYSNYVYFSKTLSTYKCDSTSNAKDYFQYEKFHHGCSSSSPKNVSFEWTLSFTNESGELIAGLGRFTSFLSDCFAPGPQHRASARRSDLNKILIGSSMAGALAFMLVCGISILKFQMLRNFLYKHKTQENIKIILENYGSLAPKTYKYAELKKITNSFRDKLGRGGFGTVYKGTQQDGHLVAVKLLHNSTSTGDDFINEVISIGRTSHVNIVKLIGFCIEGSKQALVYEYMPNGSLDEYIYTDDPKKTLGWEKLYEIAIGIARGLEYLHSGCNTHIVHFDIKPQNILLNEDFRPKIADFGLAKLCPPKESIISVAEMRGTIGFIAPEVFSRSVGVVSTKSDVYSFGMLVLEMVGGRKNFKMSVQNSSQAYFPHWIYDHIVENGEIQVCDVTNETEKFARKMALVGLWCTQMIPTNRPSISKVLEMFDKNLDELEMPPKPYFNSPPRDLILLSEDSNSENSLQNLVSC